MEVNIRHALDWPVGTETRAAGGAIAASDLWRRLDHAANERLALDLLDSKALTWWMSVQDEHDIEFDFDAQLGAAGAVLKPPGTEVELGDAESDLAAMHEITDVDFHELDLP